MKLTAISFFILFLIFISSALAIEYNFNSPESAEVNEIFQVSISAENFSDVYDVKIWVEDNNSGKIISQTYNEDKWKSSSYYVISVFPETKDFDIKLINYSDNAQICIRLRKTGAKTTPIASCKLIDAKQSSQQNQNETANQANNQNQSQENNETEEEENPSEKNETQNQFLTNEKAEISSFDSEKIVLTPKKSSSENNFITKEEKINLFAVYSFTFLVIVLLALVLLRKI